MQQGLPQPIVITDSIRSLLERVSAKQKSGLVRLVIEGESGIGKRTAVGFAATQMKKNRHNVVLEALADPLGAPYMSIAEIFRGVSKLNLIRARIKHVNLSMILDFSRLIPLLGDYAERVSDLEEMYLGSGLVPVSPVREIIATLRMIVSDLTCHSRKPIFLLMNVHQFDLSSLYVLSEVMRICVNEVSCIAVFDEPLLEQRPTHERTRVRDFVQTCKLTLGFETFEMKPMHAQEIQQFLEVSGEGATRDRIEGLARLSGGNPLYLRELIASNASSSMATKASQVRISGKKPTLNVPSRLTGMVESRLSSMEPQFKGVLDVASVVGYRFACPPVAYALGEKRISVARSLQEIHRRYALIHPVELLYQFTHEVVQAVAYESQNATLLRETHRLIAEYIAREVAQGDKDYWLYYHFDRAGDESKAFDHLLRACQFALEMQYIEEAIVRITLLLSEDSERHHLSSKDRCLWILHLARLLNASGASQKARNAADQVLTLSPVPQQRNDALLQIATSWYLDDRMDEALSVISQALSARAALTDKCAVRLIQLSACAYYHLGKWAEARHAYRRCFKFPELNKNRDLYSSLLKMINMFYIPELALPRLLKHFNEELNEQSYLRFEFLHNISTNHLLLGDLDEAAKSFTACREFLSKTSPLRLAYVLNNLGIVRLLSDQLESAKSLFEEVIDISPSNFEKCSSSINLALVLSRLGQPQIALNLLWSTQDEITRNRIPVLGEYTRHNIGWLLLENGEYAAAIEMLSADLPTRQCPWLSLKLRQRLLLVQRCARELDGIRTDVSGRVKIPAPSGRKDAWLFEKYSFQFCELWFWE